MCFFRVSKDTQSYDGTFENITEEYVDITQDAWYGRQVSLGAGFRSDYGQNFPDSDRKVASWFNIPNDFSIDYMSFYGRTRDDADNISIRFAVYNDTWDVADGNAHPVERLGYTQDTTINDTQQYWNASFSTPLFLEGGHRYWLCIHFDGAIRIWRPNLIRMNYNKSAKCQDTFPLTSDPFDLEDPHEWSKWGVAYDIAAYGNETVQNYQMDYEFQFQSVNPNYDYYVLQVYGWVSSGTEEFQIHVWDPPPDSEWDYWGEGFPYWKLNATERWVSQALFQHINETITIRFKGADESASDQTADTITIDAIFLYGYSLNLDIVQSGLSMASPYNPGSGLVEFDQSPITVNVECGSNWNILYKGGTATIPNWVWISNSSDPDDAVPLIVWGTSDPLYTESQARGDGYHTIQVWVFLYVPLPDPPDDYDGDYETYVQLRVTGDLLTDPIPPIP